MYSIELEPGTYTVSVTCPGFCTLRRGAFVLEKHSTVHFDFQMWVCPTHVQFVHYMELEEVPHTHLKPLIMFAKSHVRSDLVWFEGPTTHNDGTGRPRKYPAIFSFNLLTVQAETLFYKPTNHTLTAIGKVVWQAGSESGTATNIEVKLDGLKPRPNR